MAASRGRGLSESAGDSAAVVLLALPPEAAILPAAESTRPVRNREALPHRIRDNGDQLPHVFPVVGQNRKRLHYDFRRRGLRDRYDFRLAASGEFGVSGELDPAGIACAGGARIRDENACDDERGIGIVRKMPELRRGQAADIPSMDVAAIPSAARFDWKKWARGPDNTYQLRVEAGVVKSTASGTYGAQ